MSGSRLTRHNPYPPRGVLGGAAGCNPLSRAEPNPPRALPATTPPGALGFRFVEPELQPAVPATPYGGATRPLAAAGWAREAA